ncbi:MAG: hypothetical protein J7527_05520 [Chitinophagaceae bacterium]|nr:hypothetical protein [Chitinophagaceae bacterium]
MAKYSKGARKGVKSAMKRTEGGTSPKKKSAKKAATKKSAAKKSAVKKSAAKKNPVKKSAVKRAAPKKSTAGKKSAAKKTTVKKIATKKTVTKKTAPKKAVTKKVTAKKAAPRKRTPQAEETTQLRSATAEMEMPVAENNVQTGMLRTDDPVRSAQRKDFDHHTSKGDPRQHLPISSKPKGGIKPSGKKPLWN